jgi:hypothetical protein
MRFIFSRLTIALLTFIIGVSLTLIWISGRRLSPVSSEDALPASTEETISRPTESDWKPHLTCNEFSSSKGARRALREELSFDGYKIISRGAKLNAEGQRVGRRVVAVYCCGKEGQQAAHILWTDVAKFCDLAAPSVQRALDFEKSNQ